MQVTKRQGYRKILTIKHPLVKGSVRLIVHLQVQPLHHIQHDRRGLQGEKFVVYVRAGLEKTHIGKHGTDIAREGLPFAVFLDKQRGGTGVHGRGTQQVNGCDAQGDYQGNYEPAPFAEAKGQQVLNTQKIIILLLWGCHIDKNSFIADCF